MSKKKISQIVGLTIGATAIAATGIGSSIALTSCTAPASETDTSISLTTEQVGMAFSAVKKNISNPLITIKLVHQNILNHQLLKVF